jgi:geranylgeranyl diphosphate synthase, type I
MLEPSPNTLRQEIERCRRLTDALLLDPGYRARFGPEHIRRAVYAYLERPAKRLRPALVLLCCGAVGGDEQQALPAAAAVELFHTWTLVHDDIIDDDALRRGRPTVHVEAADWAAREFGAGPAAAQAYGRDVAILAGDVQQAWATAMLLECAQRGVPARVVLGLAMRLQTVLNHRLIEGEMLDVQLSYRPIESVAEADVLEMIRLKTGVLLEYCAGAGAAIGCGRLPGEDPVVDALGDFATLCGQAFQLQDDILGVTGDERQLGKSLGADIRAGKATIIVLHALRTATAPQAEVIRRTLGRADAPAAEVAAVRRLLVDLGSVDYAGALAERCVGQALARLQRDVPPSPQRGLLEAWARSMVERTS